VIAHEAAPGFTFPEIGTVDYGYWELKVACGDLSPPEPVVY
jgi:hypothetical protein